MGAITREGQVNTRMSVRRTRWLLAAVVILSMLAPAWAGAAPRNVTLTLVTVMPGPDRDALIRTMLQQFEAQNPGIKVNHISLPWEQSYQKLLTMVTSGQVPDVLEMPEKWAAQFVSLGVLEDLETYVAKWPRRTEFADAAWDAGRIVGKLYLIPWGFYERALYYRADWFKEAGLQPPATFPEFLEAARKLTNPQKGRYGYAFRGGPGGWDNVQLWMLAYEGSGRYFDEQNRSLLDAPGAVEGLKAYVSLYKNRWAPPDSVTWGFNDIVGAFYAGKAAMLDQDPDTLEAVRTHMAPGTYAVAPLPVGPHGKTFFQLGFPGWAMSSKTRNKSEAWALLSFLASPENSVKFDENTGAIPPLKSVSRSSKYSDPIYKAWMLELNDNVRYRKIVPPWHLPEWGTFFNQVAPAELQKVLLGQASPEQAARTWAEFLTQAQARYLAGRR